ncbi:ligase [Desulfofustis phage LS06-2018-MD01]|nr:ligase [Desulfofustis phage LS06-2018-MD01]
MTFPCPGIALPKNALSRLSQNLRDTCPLSTLVGRQ